GGLRPANRDVTAANGSEAPVYEVADRHAPFDPSLDRRGRIKKSHAQTKTRSYSAPPESSETRAGFDFDSFADASQQSRNSNSTHAGEGAPTGGELPVVAE